MQNYLFLEKNESAYGRIDRQRQYYFNGVKYVGVKHDIRHSTLQSKTIVAVGRGRCLSVLKCNHI